MSFRYCSRKACRKKLNGDNDETYGFMVIDDQQIRFNFCKECSDRMGEFFKDKKISNSDQLQDYMDEENI